MIKHLKLSVNESEEFITILEDDYFVKLEKTMTYEPQDDPMIKILALLEALVDAHKLIKEGRNAILVYVPNEPKDAILDMYKQHYPEITISEIEL